MKKLIAPFAISWLSTAAVAAPAPSWTVNVKQSQIAFTGAMSGQPFKGSFRRFDSHIAFDPANLAGSSVATTVYTGSASTGDQTRDEAMPTSDWFDVSVFPQATFSASQFKKVGPDRYIASGVLSIRGMRHPIALPFQLTINGNSARMQGSVTLDRRWFGVGQGQFASIDTVAANVRVDLLISATKGR